MLSGCASAATGTDPQVVDSLVAQASGLAAAAAPSVIDVRTPSEYAAGHLDGAVNYDVSAASFDTQVGALPRSSHYVLYCRSGNRSAAAAERMRAMGFVSVTDAGSMSDAADATGLTVVS